jgi:hypothetical protein
MSARRFLLVSILPCVLATTVSGQVVFSRRIYKESGRSWQQIWQWNPIDRSLKELTHSSRDHYHPICTRGGITFTSPSADDSDHVKLWTFDPSTGREQTLGPAPEPAGPPNRNIKGCDQFAKAGALEACGNDEDLAVSRAGKEIGRFNIQVNICPIDNKGTIGKCETPIRSLDWTEDAKWLLVGEEAWKTAAVRGRTTITW